MKDELVKLATEFEELFTKYMEFISVGCTIVNEEWMPEVFIVKEAFLNEFPDEKYNYEILGENYYKMYIDYKGVRFFCHTSDM
jgi:hypothetical protein